MKDGFESKFVFLETLYGMDSFEKLQEHVCMIEELDSKKNIEEFARIKGKHLVIVRYIEILSVRNIITIRFDKESANKTISYQRDAISYQKDDGPVFKTKFAYKTRLTWGPETLLSSGYEKVLFEFIPPEKLIPHEWITEKSVWIEGPKN